MEGIEWGDVQVEGEEEEGEMREIMEGLPEVVMGNSEEVEALKQKLQDSERMVEDLK